MLTRHRFPTPLLPLALLGLLVGKTAGAQLAGEAESGDAGQQSRYAVELILFTYDASVPSGSEVFLPEEPPAAEMAGNLPYAASGPDGEPVFGDRSAVSPSARTGSAVETVPEQTDALAESSLEDIVTAASVELAVLPPDALTLAEVHEKLLLLDAYRPVLWSGWTQNVREQSRSPAIDLRRLGNVPLVFDGELTLYLGRFVHLVVDLRLEERETALPLPNPDPGDARSRRFGVAGDPAAYRPRIVYRIREDRIMRNGEIRYFDHPKFGMIAKLSLVEEEPPVDPDTDDPTGPPAEIPVPGQQTPSGASSGQ